MINVLVVTGSRDWPARHRDTIEQRLFDFLPDSMDARRRFRLYHGAAKGVDDHARRWGHLVGIQVIGLSADWREGKSAGPRRNERMLNAAASWVRDQGNSPATHLRVVAFPMGKSSGTRGCIRIAERMGLSLRVREFPYDTGTETDTSSTQARTRPICLCGSCVREREAR